jgi:hypothetical protein
VTTAPACNKRQHLSGLKTVAVNTPVHMLRGSAAQPAAQRASPRRSGAAISLPASVLPVCTRLRTMQPAATAADATEAPAAGAPQQLPATYRRLVAARTGAAFREVARVVDAQMPAPGPGEVLVRMRYAGINGGCAARPGLGHRPAAPAAGARCSAAAAAPAWGAHPPSNPRPAAAARPFVCEGSLHLPPTPARRTSPSAPRARARWLLSARASRPSRCGPRDLERHRTGAQLAPDAGAPIPAGGPAQLAATPTRRTAPPRPSAAARARAGERAPV